MKTFFLKIMFLFLLFFFFMQIACFAESKKGFVIGVQNYKEYLPYSAVTKNGYEGFNRVLLDEFAKSKGYHFKYAARPIKRLISEFLHGEFDFKYPDNPYWSANLKKGKEIKYSDPIVNYIDGVVVLKENLGKGVSNLRLLGIVAGFTPLAYLNMIKSKEIEVHENKNIKGLLGQVKLKRVDGAYLNIAVSKYYLKRFFNDADYLVFDPDLPHTRSKRYLSSFKYPNIIIEFNHYMKNNHEHIEELKKTYHVEDGL